MRVVVLVLVLAFFGPAFGTGGVDGAGGDAVVCYTSQGHMLSRLFDLFEGEALYAYKPQFITGTYDVQALVWAKQLDVANPRAVNFFYEETLRLLKIKRFLPKNTELNPVKDSDSIIKPGAGCKIVQAAIYDSVGRLYLDSNIWDSLPETDRAGLILHEAIYAYLRLYDADKNSRRARQYTSYIVSGGRLDEVDPNSRAGIPYEYCQTDGVLPNPEGHGPTRFTTIPNSDGTWSFHFTMFNGHTMLTSLSLRPQMGSYTWPASDHDDPNYTGPEDKVTGPLVTAVDEGFDIRSILFLRSHNKHTMIVNSLNGSSRPFAVVCTKKGWGTTLPDLGLDLQFQKAILIDAPQTSCLAANKKAPPDLNSLSLNLGRLKINWNPPSSNSTLRIINVSARLSGNGLVGSAQSTVIDGEELACILNGHQGAQSIITPITPRYESGADLVLGGFTAFDLSKSASFSGQGSLLIHGYVHTPGTAAEPVQAVATFDYFFSGISAASHPVGVPSAMSKGANAP